MVEDEDEAKPSTNRSYSLNCLKGVKQGMIIGVIKGDTSSLDNGSYGNDYFELRT